MPHSGKFIVIEGLEGAGKSTAIDVVLSTLTTHGIDSVSVREPGGTLIAEQIRTILKTSHEEYLNRETELLLMYAARSQLIQEIIYPALSHGKWVIADRFEWSTYAYQGWGRGIETRFIDALSELCTNNLQPDLIIYLNIDPEHGLKRAAERSKKDRIEQEDLTFFRNVQKGYQHLCENSKNCLMIDASLPLKTVQLNIQEAIEKLIS